MSGKTALQRQTFSSGGIRFRLETDADWPFTLRNSFQLFRSAMIKADICWRFHRIETSGEIPPPLTQATRSLLSRTRRSGLDSPLLRSPRVRARLEQCLKEPEKLTIELQINSVTLLDFARRRGDLFYAADSADSMKECSIEPATIAPFLPSFSSLLFHAAAWAGNGRAALFLAPDEGGKTTAVRLLAAAVQGGTVLGDDQVIVRRHNGDFWVYGTPWGRLVSAAHGARLGALFLLEKAGSFSIAPLHLCETVGAIWKEHEGYMRLLPNDLKKKALAMICEICEQVAAFRLAFSPDELDAAAISRVLAAEKVKR